MEAVVALSMNPSIDISTSVDRIMPIRKLRCSAARRDPGGGGVNVARVARRLGAEATVVYPAGGSTGKLLQRLVDQEGVQSRALAAAQETREDFTVFEAQSGSQFRFILPGPRLAEREWRACLEAVASSMSRAQYVVASGSLPPGVPEDFYGRIARLAKTMGVKLVLDSSGAPLRVALKEGVYLVKPNLNELRELVSAPLETEDARVEASRGLVKAECAEVVALTLGDGGALLVTRDHAWRAQALPIKVASAVGAGDSFLGALVWSLVSGHGLSTAFRYANAAGSAAVLAPGTELCRPDDVKRLYDQVVIRELRGAPTTASAAGGGSRARETSTEAEAVTDGSRSADHT